MLTFTNFKLANKAKRLIRGKANHCAEIVGPDEHGHYQIEIDGNRLSEKLLKEITGNDSLGFENTLRSNSL